MRDLKYILKKRYDCSRALVIGINQYENASPLGYAVSDAEAVKSVLIQDLGFSAEDIVCLVDSKATKVNILKHFLSFTSEEIKVDDRLLVFFAGHGFTRTGFRGEVGYLVPYDADMNDLSSLIRWDDLTKNSELIRAKHILFVMDACYGGLAVNRDIQPGSSRFLQDMYQRFSRQVITAGKADEVVADSGGPLPNHSVFTGHFIEGVRGKAANEYGVITASGLMAYVYTKVANDVNSTQTPHYGQFDGDGDFILSAPSIDTSKEDQEKGIDSLMSIPYVEEARSSTSLDDKIEYLKELLSSEKSQIRLNDFVIYEVRSFLSITSEDNFKVNGNFSDEELLERISLYENCTKELGIIASVISYWCSDSELNSLSTIVSRASDRLIESSSGLMVWSNLRWYPLLLIFYHAGIAAVESKNYKSMVSLFYAKVGGSSLGHDEPFFIQRLSNGISELNGVGVFKRIPGHERNLAPVSEYLFKQIQPTLDDLFFLGKGYEEKFDEFEVLYALLVVDLRLQLERNVWGPIGRFGWKYKSQQNSPFSKLLLEARSIKDNWPPIRAGLFGGSYERFELAAKNLEELLGNLRWY